MGKQPNFRNPLWEQLVCVLARLKRRLARV